MLQQMNPKHCFEQNLMPALSGAAVMQCYSCQQTLPGNDGSHLFEKLRFVRLLTVLHQVGTGQAELLH